ncbi:MAG: hypothetical protein H0T49_01840 [Chloroflexia bacterium]|nr:hypothetical protein [Chloroflexia bacterium]
MIQRTAGAYIVKKIGNELMPSAAKPEPESEREPVREPNRVAPVVEFDELNERIFHDEEGNSLGIAHRLPEVAVYVVLQGRGNPAETLHWAAGDEETQRFVRRVNGRVTGLIYVPDPNRAPLRIEATRADDV